VLCEWDMLQAEGHTFADRIRARGKAVGVRVVDKEKHAWDKPPPLSLKPSAQVEYDKAIEAMKAWIIGGGGAGGDAAAAAVAVADD
jgi:putative ergosteryl-3beta-O-L-aspartate hydrolase